MLLRKIIITCAIAGMASLQALSAKSGIGLVLLSYTLSNPDLKQAERGFTITVNARLINYDSTQYVGLIDFGVRNSRAVLTDRPGIFSRPSFSGYPIILDGGETVPAIFNVHLDAQYFIPGPDVVVVWPITRVPVSDTVEIPFTVMDNGTLGINNGIEDFEQPPFSYTVLQDRIVLLNLAPEIAFKQVRIFDLEGRTMSELKASYITEVPIPALPKGIYLSEFIAADGKRKVIKFWH